MGIKGIYKEIGTGKRVSLCKLAVDQLENTGRPLRIAIDFAIWQFQTQAGKGGSNPAIRTLFYRLVRLLSLSIQPIFVFDGPNKPVFKRNKRSGKGCGVASAMAKRLIGLFGFQIHDAPGEAEAECALLQQKGIVDAVLSEDVDTIMFGCTKTMRNWSSEGTKGNKTPTHVSVYDAAELRQSESGLDREGMVLVALMSGGDYIPEGVPGCGVKVACEAAKAGYGKSLCRLKRSDTAGLQEWRENLMHELRTNDNKFFRVKHKALTIPDEFPNVEVLRYYTHPVVSSDVTREKLRRSFPPTKSVDVVGLRDFAAETFDWTFKGGAIKFIRVMAPSLLVQAMNALAVSQEAESEDLDARQEVESQLVKSITTKRVHFSTDATPELRISFIPNDIVGLDLDAEEEEEEVTPSYGRQGLALNSDDDFDEQLEDGEDLPKSGPKKVFDPLEPDLVWLPATFAKLSIPLTVEDWEEKQRAKEISKAAKTSRAAAKNPRKPSKKADIMPAGALDKWVNITKNIQPPKQPEVPPFLLSVSQSQPPLSSFSSSQQVRAISSTARQPPSKPKPPAVTRMKQPTGSKGKAPASPKPSSQINPWTLASSQASPRASHSINYSKAILISSSPVGPTASPARAPLKDSAMSANSSFTAAPDADPFNSPPSSPRRRYSPDRENPPAAKGTHKSRAAAREASPTGRRLSTRAAQASIKSFARVSKVMAETVDPNKGSSFHDDDCDSGSDFEFGDLQSLGSKKTVIREASSKRLGSIRNLNDGAGPPRQSQSTKSSLSTKSKTTRLYMPGTSDVGYFMEVEVTREEADRITSEQSSRPANKRDGGRRIWRQSEISMVDLTGYD